MMSGQAASPTPFTQHSEAGPLDCAGATPNHRVVPDVNHGFAYPTQPSWALPPLHEMGSLLWAKLPFFRVYSVWGSFSESIVFGCKV
ncbi:hypothetical protein Desaci_3731 [Desulfosporosinus acidiphilus SJ4]|uniref:Uncharacterized protein n=1 Tax=Desulfosporosinus acidiphilus (strain DSM 22704 / JCM 16185 / SJ4) TaxID=646529 RepID=I4D9Y8_DESAJ|nr:hypothetical protein Desaci_3731 [Desulfosporosinus acidiphilus SJ4]